MKQDIDNLAIALAVAGIDDNITVSKLNFGTLDKTVYTIKSDDKRFAFDYTIDPEHCDNSEDILKNVLALAHKDLGCGKIPFKMLESENQQVDATCRIINAKKKWLLDTLDKYLAIQDSNKRNKSPERQILNDFLVKMENYTTSLYFESNCFYDTKQYAISEIMYSLLSTISGEEMGLDKDILSSYLNPDQVFAEIYKTHNQVKKDEYDYYNLNYRLSKLRLGQPLSIDEEIALLNTYYDMGVIKGVDIKTNLKDIFGYDPLDYSDSRTYADIEEDEPSDEEYEDVDENDEDNEDIDQNDSDDSEKFYKNINAFEAETMGVLHYNINPKENDIAQIDISTLGLNLINHIRIKKKLDELKAKYADDPNIRFVDDQPSTPHDDTSYNGLLGEIVGKYFGSFAEMIDKFFESGNQDKGMPNKNNQNNPPMKNRPDNNQNPNNKPTNNPKPTGFDSSDNTDDGLQDNGGKEKERDDDMER